MAAGSPDAEQSANPRSAMVRRIRFLVQTHRMTIPDLAAAIEVRPSVLQEVVDGAAEPTAPLIRKLTSHFGVSEEFLAGEGRPSGSPVQRPSRTREERSRAAGSRGVRTPRVIPSTLSLETLAVRHQALLETLIASGVIGADDYHARIEEIEKRSAAKRRRKR